MTSEAGLTLPAGLRSRPLTPDDAADVLALIVAEELVDLGASEMTLEDVLSEWQRPSCDLAASSMGVLDGDRLVAYGELAGPSHTYSAVHPDHQGRGIGTTIARWLQATARARGATRIGSQVPQGSAADRLMADLGYHLRWTAWDLELPEGRTVPDRPLPEGHSVGEAAETDRAVAWALVEDAFCEWPDRERTAYDDWGALVWGRPGFEPWHLRLARDADGTAVGAVHVYLTGTSAYVARLAVRRDRRGQGLAQALLVDAFRQARAHGAVRCYLATDSRTGALGLYERVGMRVASTWVNRAVDL